LNKADRDLFMYGLQMGDLVQLHADPTKIEPDNELSNKVVVGYNYEEDETYGWLNRGWYFKYIDSGALAVYMNRVSQGDSLYYWAQFHKIHCDGALCIVHEKYLYPRDWVYDPTNPPANVKKAYSIWYSGSI
jgi:hypothetical protein